MGEFFIQFVQETPRQLDIRVLPNARWDDVQRDRLLDYCRKLVGPEMRLQATCVSPDQIVTDRSGKRRMVISRVPQPEGGPAQ